MDGSIGWSCAVKSTRLDNEQNERSIARLEREIKIMKHLPAHENLLPCTSRACCSNGRTDPSID